MQLGFRGNRALAEILARKSGRPEGGRSGARSAPVWLWDFWFAQDGGDVHAFFLHAPNDLPHPDHRHRGFGTAALRRARSEMAAYFPAVPMVVRAPGAEPK